MTMLLGAVTIGNRVLRSWSGLAVTVTIFCCFVLTHRTGIASAQEPAAVATARAVIDRIDLEPSVFPGFDRLRILFSAMTLPGAVIDFTDYKAIKLMIGESEKKIPSFIIGRANKAEMQTAVVFVMQASVEFTDVAAIVQKMAAEQLGPALSNDDHIAIITYGDVVNASNLHPIKGLATDLAGLTTDGTTGVAMTEAIERGLNILKRAKPAQIRKAIILISDGRDRDNERERITALGQRAGKEGVRIHSFAFAATGARRPLLALGELSKQSLGTFRWIRTAQPESWKPAFAQLAAELANQYVLTYFVPVGEMGGKKIHIVTNGAAALSSNEARVPQAKCGEDICMSDGICVNQQCLLLARGTPRAWGKTILLFAGGLLALAGMVLAVSWRQRRRGPPGPPQTSVPAPNRAAIPPLAMPPPAKAPAKTMVMQVPIEPASTRREPSNQAPPAVAQNTSIPSYSVTPAAYKPTASLSILAGHRMGQRVSIHDGYTIGTAPDCHLVLEDPAANPRHCEIRVDSDGNCTIVDRKSHYGTFLAGQKIQTAALMHGTIIRVGNTDLRFLAE
jgi:uncharacterized protein YegL